MIIKPKCRGFICTTAHPAGCAENVKRQIDYVKGKGKINGPKNVLVIGASTGFGLSSRIASAFGSQASTIGVFFEKPGSERGTGSAGWYNSVAFENEAAKDGFYAKSINGDAFSMEVKQQTIDLIKKDLGTIDLVVYSLASPRRIDPFTGEKYNSVIKPIGDTYTNSTVDFHTKEISTVSIEPATDDDIRQTVAVMGGEDWLLWMQELKKANVLSEGVKTVAYSYIGPDLTHAIYTNGTIGKAKEHLLNTVGDIDNLLKDQKGKAFVSVNKALVTQASSAIPIIPLYISLVFKIMKEKNIHEGCIEQIHRLFNDRLYKDEVPVDEEGRIRIDDWEMRSDVQSEVKELWDKITPENLEKLTDIEGFRSEFFRLFGFGFENVDYDAEVETMINVPSIE